MDRKKLIAICVLLWLVAFGVRVLSWQDNRLDVSKVEWLIADEYKEAGVLLSHGEVSAYLHNLYYMTHPPGYPVFLAVIFKTLGNSETNVRMVQIACDALAVVVVFLIAAELLSPGVAVIAALLVAISPQLAYYPSLLLPDSVTVLPILLSVYCLALARRRPGVFMFLLAGLLIGVSCLLRANALFMAPFLAAITPLLVARGRRWRHAGALLLGTVLLIAPVTIKNLIVFHRFVPLSLGAGQKLLEGVAEFDRDGRFGVPKTDFGIVLQEVQMYNRPDYEGGLFTVDGIERDRARVGRGLSIIRAHPFWYLGVMVKRAALFLRLARVPLVAAQPTFSHSLAKEQGSRTIRSLPPAALIDNAGNSASTGATLSDNGQSLRLIGDDSKYGAQFVSTRIVVLRDSDYLISVPIKLQEGRMLVSVTSADQKRVLYAAVIDPIEGEDPIAQPVQTLDLPFATGSGDGVRLVLSNGGRKPRADLGTIKLIEFGPTSYGWTRYPRFFIHFLQKGFVTTCMLPLALVGILLLLRARRWQSLALLLIVPAYYLIVQSALHTERRYVMAIHYFLFTLAAVSIAFLVGKLAEWIGRAGWNMRAR